MLKKSQNVIFDNNICLLGHECGLLATDSMQKRMWKSMQKSIWKSFFLTAGKKGL